MSEGTTSLRDWRLLGLACLGLGLASACSEGEVCADGETQTCMCPSGGSGVATCAGGSFQDCGCASATSGDVGQACSPQSGGSCNFACL
ncbi:MAG: hypothetical protein AAFU79_34660, partial [Myxococcota bacterium]